MKRKINIKKAILFGTIVLISIVIANISYAANTGKVTGETVRLRQEASSDSKTIELIAKGTEVEILSEENGWYKVKHDSLTGYLRSDLVETTAEISTTETEATETTTETEKTEETEAKSETTTETEEVKEENTIIVNEKYKLLADVKLKMIPLIYSIDIESAKKDTEIEIVEILNNWVKVSIDGDKEGWIRKDKINVANTTIYPNCSQ